MMDQTIAQTAFFGNVFFSKLLPIKQRRSWYESGDPRRKCIDLSGILSGIKVVTIFSEVILSNDIIGHSFIHSLSFFYEVLLCTTQ